MSTYSQIYLHVVFSTKNRGRILDKNWRSELHNYCVGILKKKGLTHIVIGGVEDHIHILMGARTQHCLSDVIRELKKSSTRWIQESHHRDFHWQNGYGAFLLAQLPTIRLSNIY